MKEKIQRFLFLVVIILGCTNFGTTQEFDRFSLSLAGGMSKTGSLEYSEQYRRSSNTSTIEILTTDLSRNNNFNFAIGFQPAKSFSINGSIGVASYGFFYSGNVIASPTNFASVGGFVTSRSYTVRLMEVGLSTSFRRTLNSDLSIVVQPGLVWYTNPKGRNQQLLWLHLNSNNFSATLFTGIETPLISNDFYIAIGLNTKLALQNFAGNYTFDNKFNPYAFGLQTSISYRFGAVKSKHNLNSKLK